MTEIKRFNPSTTKEARALQAWLILIGKAAEHKSITYGCLSELMIGKLAPNVFSAPLELIRKYCKSRGIPQLSVLVVGKDTGIPEDGGQHYPEPYAEQERVFDFSWYDLFPPTESDLKSGNIALLSK